LPGRATKTAKSSKKAAPKPRGKAKRAPAKKPKKEPAEENIVQGAATPVEATPEQVAPVVSSEALYHGGPRQEELHLVEPIQREAHVTAPPQPLIAPAPEAEAIALPPSAPQVALPLEHPSSEREEERPEEPSVAEALPPRQNVPPNHVFIGKAPIMGYALSAVMQLTQYPNVVLGPGARPLPGPWTWPKSLYEGWGAASSLSGPSRSTRKSSERALTGATSPRSKSASARKNDRPSHAGVYEMKE